MGIISDRRRRQRRQRLRRRMGIALLVLLLSVMAMSDGLRGKLSDALDERLRAAQVFGQAAKAELTLPERSVFALQLGVFDNGERAAAQAQRLNAQGIRCMVWQREKMRIISSVALTREALLSQDESGQEAYIIEDSMGEIQLSITACADELDAVQNLLTMPDRLLTQLLEQEEGTMDAIVIQTRAAAQDALHAHTENALYTQLAQSLLNWCALMEQLPDDAMDTQGYAAMTMYTLCRELRLAAENQPMADSTASAQRTPSTAADVMPPA